jgi:hypothetical protein
MKCCHKHRATWKNQDDDGMVTIRVTVGVQCAKKGSPEKKKEMNTEMYT